MNETSESKRSNLKMFKIDIILFDDSDSKVSTNSSRAKMFIFIFFSFIIITVII